MYHANRRSRKSECTAQRTPGGIHLGADHPIQACVARDPRPGVGHVGLGGPWIESASCSAFV